MVDNPKPGPRNDIEAAQHIREVSEKLEAHAREMGFEKLADMLREARLEATRHVEPKTDDECEN
ncbi:hypothetical protein [Castellaniella sp.]|uniref:hypothetical protein n=1 Tax=Castellaniella sp. TaxID=1955812 RepID=UPI002AFFE7C2|nr:hypothetical protein [Castellaniella sp.]